MALEQAGGVLAVVLQYALSVWAFGKITIADQEQSFMSIWIVVIVYWFLLTTLLILLFGILCRISFFKRQILMLRPAHSGTDTEISFIFFHFLCPDYRTWYNLVFFAV